ncbi:MAG TPA: DinB family protein [Mucilaginibacter sp.]|nr:DinB family protein [Mucilaginibacter sp.]
MTESDNNKREVWLRGPAPGIPPLLQPVAHTILQAREEVNRYMSDFPEIFLWVKPGGMASPGFHLQHITGILDRLFTYAKGEGLNEQQFTYLSYEGNEPERSGSVQDLLEVLNKQVDKAIEQLSNTDELTLTEVRGVGRAQIPSTVQGLLFHAAEHMMRHTGQLLVTTRILKN